MPIHIVVGPPGSGKTLFGTKMAIKALRKGTTVFANYDINYRTPDGRSVLYTEFMALLAALELDRIKFLPGTCLFVIDEVVHQTGMESRRSGSTLNITTSKGIGTARHMGIELLIISQLSSEMDKRVRFLPDRVYVARRLPAYDAKKKRIYSSGGRLEFDHYYYYKVPTVDLDRMVPQIKKIPYWQVPVIGRYYDHQEPFFISGPTRNPTRVFGTEAYKREIQAHTIPVLKRAKR